MSHVHWLQKIRESLLRDLRVELGPEDGDIAFARHILLAVRFHHAAGLSQTVTGESQGWLQYFDEHFPKRLNWRSEDAQRLWIGWRIGLVKNEAPMKGIALTHGQPGVHWYRESSDSLCINLESMWDDFEASVDSLIDLLDEDARRCAEALERWRARSWTVRPLVVPTASKVYGVGWEGAPSMTATGMGGVGHSLASKQSFIPNLCLVSENVGISPGGCP